MSETVFSNDNIPEAELSSLPTIQTLAWQQLSEKYAPLKLQVNLLSTLLLIVVGSIVYCQPWFILPRFFATYLPYLLALVVLIGFSLSVVVYFADQRKHYALRELDLHFSCGLIFRKVVSQPITRIQHIELTRGPLERYKGLASLQVFSAGGAMHTFEIPGLTLHQAQDIRQFILKHKDLALHG